LAGLIGKLAKKGWLEVYNNVDYAFFDDKRLGDSIG
jgi:hypothetical protein